MKKNEVKVGGVYVAKVGNNLVKVRIDNVHSQGGWNATSTKTSKLIRIKSAQRLRGADDDEQPKTNETAGADKAAPGVKAAGKPKADVTEAKKPVAKKAKPKKTGGKKKPKRVSALDAAAQVLSKTEKPMGARDLIAAMTERRLWSSPGGKTPHATLYAAIHREIAAKGDAARFKKVDRGLFEINA